MSIFWTLIYFFSTIAGLFKFIVTDDPAWLATAIGFVILYRTDPDA